MFELSIYIWTEREKMFRPSKSEENGQTKTEWEQVNFHVSCKTTPEARLDIVSYAKLWG